MSAARAGPELPPHLLAKRKRAAETNITPEQQPLIGVNKSRSSSAESAIKRRRVIGPAPPPAPLSEKPPGYPGGSNESSDEDEDDFGPSLPGQAADPGGPLASVSYRVTCPEPEKPDTQVRRDDWMTMPPKQDDLASRLDPTKPRARGFNTGKGAKGANTASGGDNAIWTETPEQKRKRLEDEILGVVQAPSSGKEVHQTQRNRAEDKEKARKIQEYNENHRSKSLYEQHKGSATKQKEDDPSKRGFDYEKDMAVGSKIGHAQKREMLTRAADFGSRFSKGNYL